MEITPQDVQQKQFDLVKRGFDPQQVGMFLDQVAAALAKRDRVIQDARTEIEALSQATSDAEHNQEAFRLTMTVATQTMEEMLRKAEERVARIEEEARTSAEFILERAKLDAEDQVTSVKQELESLRAERDGLESQLAGLRGPGQSEESSPDPGPSDPPGAGRRPLELVVDRAIS